MKYQDSMKWYKQLISEVNKTSRNELGVFVDNTLPGQMYFFNYNPKTKLAYYDQAPLVLVIRNMNDGFYGLNLHYLPPLMRSKLLTQIMKIVENDKLTEERKRVLTWQILKSSVSHTLIKPTIKRYLNSNIQSKVMKVNSKDWNKTILLPLQKFIGKPDKLVYKDLGLL